MYHNGVRKTLTQLPNQYWVEKGCQLVKRLIQECVATENLKDYRVKHHQLHSLQNKESKKKDPSNILGLIIVDLDVLKQEIQQRRVI